MCWLVLTSVKAEYYAGLGCQKWVSQTKGLSASLGAVHTYIKVKPSS